MTQAEQLSWIPPQVSVTEQGGDLILENPIPLAEYPANLGVWLRQNAARFPDKPFVLQRDASGAWSGPTYAEALARVNRLSNGLLALGLDGSTPIAIMSENSVEMALVAAGGDADRHCRGTHQLRLLGPLARPAGTSSTSSTSSSRPSSVMSDADLHMAKLTQWDLSGCNSSPSHMPNTTTACSPL